MYGVVEIAVVKGVGGFGGAKSRLCGVPVFKVSIKGDAESSIEVAVVGVGWEGDLLLGSPRWG